MVDKYFEVTNIYVAVLVITDLIGGGTPATQGLIRCTFNLDNVIVGLSASVNQPARAGWLFEGSTTELPVGRFIAYIANTFGVEDLPGFITGITLENVAVSYDTGSKQFTFATTGNIPVGEKTLRIQVKIVVTRPAIRSRRSRCGTIEIGTAEFALDFSSGSSNTSFKANWVKKDGESLDLADIGGALPNLQSLLSPPKAASLELSFDDDNEVKRLTLTCTLENGAKAAFLLTQDSSVPKPQWIAALGLQAPRISTITWARSALCCNRTDRTGQAPGYRGQRRCPRGRAALARQGLPVHQGVSSAGCPGIRGNIVQLSVRVPAGRRSETEGTGGPGP